MSVQGVIINQGSYATDAEMADVAEACTQQALNELCDVWGVSGALRAGKDLNDRKPGEWVMLLLPQLPVADALGYHTRTRDGAPVLYVSPELDKLDGVPWSTTASHEWIETLVDKLCVLTIRDANGQHQAVEPADAVEQDSYVKKVSSGNSIAVSNFVTGAWYAPPEDATGAAYDYLKLCTAAGEIRPGGYSSTEESDGSMRRRTHPDKPPRAYRQMQHALSRHARRIESLYRRLREPAAA